MLTAYRHETSITSGLFSFESKMTPSSQEDISGGE